MLFLHFLTRNRCQIFSYLTAIILTFASHISPGQIFGAEQNPPSIKWKQINSPNFQLIYPSEIESEAQRMANTLTSIINKVSYSLRKSPKKISIILQNQGIISNGFVQLAPRRSEFFTTPGQEFDYQDWLNGLAIHELRHVVQFDKLTGGFKAPLFEELALAIFGITLPNWFYEGDAVGIETALTTAGRGRQPEWDIAFRTNLLNGKKYSYSKDFLGSVKDFTPGYYQLGFYLTSKLRKDYGSEIMDNIYNRISNNFLRPYNLSNSIKKYTGLSTRELHDSLAEELKQTWLRQQDSIKPEEYLGLKHRVNETPESYLLPIATNEASILFLKESKAKTSAIVELDNQGKEHTIINIGVQQSPHYSYVDQIIVWDELRFDPRFQKRSFNVINRFDIKTETFTQLTHKSRLFAPSLSPDGQYIIAVEVSYSNNISLVELNAKNGREIRRYNSPQNLMLQTPSYDLTGQKIAVTAVSQEGKTILVLDRNTGKFEQQLPYQKQLLSRPVFTDNSIIFKAHYNGIDNLYRLNLSTKKLTQLTSVRFGALNPSFDKINNKIFFNNYQVSGYNISYISMNQSMDKPVKEAASFSIDYAQPLAIQEPDQNVFDSIPSKKYISQPYQEFKNLFYFHSLEPILEENNYDDYNYGVKIRSDNKLNTLSFYSGYRFNNALKKSEYQGGFTYSRFYPILEVAYTNQARLIYQRNVFGGATQLVPITWRENLTAAEIAVPFAFNRLNHIYNITIKGGTSYTSRYDIINGNQNFIHSLKFPLHYQLSLSHNILRSARDLAPKWGQNATLTFRHFPFENRVIGKLLTFKSNFYFPGIATNHSFQASFNYQFGNGSYENTVDIPYISGYHNLKPTGNLDNTLLLDYRFPIFYPDWELGPLAYIKRIKGGFFADFENVGFSNNFSPRTFGAELRADMNLLRFFLPNFDIGGKIIFINEKPSQNPIFETTLFYNF